MQSHRTTAKRPGYCLAVLVWLALALLLLSLCPVGLRAQDPPPEPTLRVDVRPLVWTLQGFASANLPR